MKYHYAAITDRREKMRTESRSDIDHWAADRCKDGRNVDVYASIPSRSGPGRTPVLVGKWRQPGVE